MQGRNHSHKAFCIYCSILILVTIKATQTTCLCSLVDGSAILWENQCISYFGLLIRLCSQMLLWNFSFLFTARGSFNRNLGFQHTPGSSYYTDCVQSSSPVTVVFSYTTNIIGFLCQGNYKNMNPLGSISSTWRPWTRLVASFFIFSLLPAFIRWVFQHQISMQAGLQWLDQGSQVG